MKSYPSYKDSGVEWIGEIPSGWDIKKIKSLNEKVMIALQLGLLSKSGSSQQGSIFSGYKKALVELGVIEFDYVTKPFKALTASEALEIPLILDKLHISADLTSK